MTEQRTVTAIGQCECRGKKNVRDFSISLETDQGKLQLNIPEHLTAKLIFKLKGLEPLDVSPNKNLN